MKIKTLLALAALTALAIGADAQTPTKTPPMKTPTKKAMPMRDPKTGRFIKKAMPPRDPKTGRFMKAHSKSQSTATRDPKTGRFIKKKG